MFTKEVSSSDSQLLWQMLQFSCSLAAKWTVVALAQSDRRARAAGEQIKQMRLFMMCGNILSSVSLPFVPLLKFVDGRLLVEFDAVNWSWFDFFFRCSSSMVA